MFKFPDHLQSNSLQTSMTNKYTSEFEGEDIKVWTKLFDQSQILDQQDRIRVNHIFNKLITSIAKYEREQDFQLLEALSKRILSIEKDRNENDEEFVISVSDRDRLNKVRTLCKRSKHYPFIDTFFSTIFTSEKSNDLILPPITKRNQQARSSLSFDDTHITIPTKKRAKTSEIDSSTTTRSKPLMMHGPLTLQNIYEAIPAATLHFAEDEYIWHANRPVNMILATGVQLPNVLTESLPNPNIESDQFFSKILEEMLDDHRKRNPSDHSSALKQWKDKDNLYLQSLTPRRMNGFEALLDVVQRRHLGKIQRYFLNVVSTNRHFHPYDLITVPEYQVEVDNHYVFSVFGILNVRNNGLDVEFFELAEWYRHAKLWHACRQIQFFRDYLITKQFHLWLANARFAKFARHRSEIHSKHLLLMDNSIFQTALLQIRRVILEYQQLSLLPKLFTGMSLSLNDFEIMVKRHTKDIIEYTKKFYNHIKTILDMTRDNCGKKLHLILKCLEEDNLTFQTTSQSMYEQRIRKENLRRELEQMQNDMRNICPFLNLCSVMLSSCLCDIERQALDEFDMTRVMFLTKLHLSDFDHPRMLRYLPSWEDYQENFQKILQQPQKILQQQWKEILQLDTCLKDTEKFGQSMREQGLINQCEKCGKELYPGLEEKSSNSCQCQNQSKKNSKKSSEFLTIKGHGFFGSTDRNGILPFEFIFTKDAKYNEQIETILTKFRLSFDELDTYCESNEWLCEINRFCRQWTPNQMKQMSEGKQVFLIEEQLNHLRGWIDKTRTFELTYTTSNSPYVVQMDCSIISRDLCEKIERIYQDFGKYLHRYACSNAQILIDKFQTALQIFDNRPTVIEDFAKYATYLIPHKFELSANQQTIEYFTNLFDIVYQHFGHLRQENVNEQIEKSLVDTWKLFQKKLSDAADFVAQQTLIIKERLRDTFERYFNEAELLFNQSTSGIFLDPTQDPMDIVKQLKKNCIEFLHLEKQLRQYGEWRMLLASNSLNPSDDDLSDNQQLENINQWSSQIDLRKDLWKYLEITTSSIKEWKNTFINKFNIRRAQEKIECWLKIAEDFREKISDDDPILLYWIEILQGFEQNIELLKKLLSDAMTVEQWKLLFRANGHDYNPQENYRIRDLIDFNILQIENEDIFNQIHKQATREQKLKEKLIHMQTWLNDLHYRMAKYRPPIRTTQLQQRLTSSYRQRLSRYRELRSRTTATERSPSEAILATEVSNEEAFIMINSQEILRLIEDRLLLLHTNESFHGNSDTRREEFQQYYTLFDNVKEMTQLWFETQNKWIFLRNALANFPSNTDEQEYFKGIFIQFNEVDENFRNFQKLAFQNPSVAGLAKVEMNRIHFRTWLKTFDELVNQLDFYLTDQYRSKFGRFYFLSNDELVNLISCGLDPRLYIPFVRQLFPGIRNIHFHLPEQTIGTKTHQTINSATMDVYAYRLEGISVINNSHEKISLISKLKLLLPTIDTVSLSTHLISSQSLTKWFNSLERFIRYSLAKLIWKLYQQKINEQLEEFLFKQIRMNENNQLNYPVQVILLVEHLLFTQILHKYLMKKENLSIRNLKYKIDGSISNQTKEHSLILQRLYFRDVLTRLIEHDENLNINSYEWLSLIKYQIDWNESTDRRISLVQFSNRLFYNYQYLEMSSTFVISPMMERTIFQLSQSISAFRIGLLHGPSQYGRSAIVQCLSQLCGMNCVELLCHSLTNGSEIENYHQGLITSNSWCLFKDIHRLSLDCLSKLSVAIRHIRVQLEEYPRFSHRSIQRSKSQTNLSHFSSPSPYSNEYPIMKKLPFQSHCIVSNRELISLPSSYGLFATFDDFYRPISSTIKFECRTISMSQPDLKMIGESLFYKYGIFTINEQEDCRETAYNLVDFLEYLRLIFDQNKWIYSPFILLRSIIEQSMNKPIKKSIELVLKRYHISHSHLLLILEQFFPENSSQTTDKDEELCYIDSLKQQAYDDKITFDNEQIFIQASRLMYSIKRNDFIYLIGPTGSAKSSLIRLVERTINKQMSTVNVDTSEDDQQRLVIINKVFPNSFDEEDFSQKKNSFLEQWKRYYSTIISTDSTSDQYWIIFDLNSHFNWLDWDHIQYIFNELFSSLSRQDGSVKLLIECDQIPKGLNETSSISHRTFLLNLDKFPSSIKYIQSAARNLELRLHLLDSTLSSIKDFVTDVIDPYIKYLEKERISEGYLNNYLDSFIKILSTYIEQHLIDVQQNLNALNYMFAYAFIWSYVHPIHFKYEQEINRFVRDLLKSYDFPPNDCKLTDLYPELNSNSARFVPVRSWLKSHGITYDCIPEFEGSMRLMSMLISSNYPIGLYSYEQGFGKTTLMKQLLTNNTHLRLLSTGESPSLLRNELLQHNSSILTRGKLIRGSKFVVWIEDVKEKDMELIRSWIDDYSGNKQEDLNIVLTGQRFDSYSPRFTRHFVPIILHQSISTLIASIYSIPIKNWLEEFSVDAISHPIELAHACLITLEEIFQFIRESLNKYQWNLHHVESVVNGMLLLDGKNKRTGLQKELAKINARLNKKKQQDEQVATIVRLLFHEFSRTILDRLTDPKDRLLFGDFLYKTIVTNFCTELEFHIVPTNDGDYSSDNFNQPPMTATGKKQVKFKLGLVSDRSTVASLEGPILSFGKLIGLPKIKHPSKISNPDDLIEKLTQWTYFSKQILPMHAEYIGDRGLFTNQYQESNDESISIALRSCQSRMGKTSPMDFCFIPRTCRHLINLIRIFSYPQNGHALLRTNRIGLGREDFVQFAAYISRQLFFDAHSSIPMIDENQSVRQCLRSTCLLTGLKQKNAVILIREYLLSDQMIEQLNLFAREGTYPGLFSNEELIRIAAAMSPGLPISRRVNKTNSVLKTFYSRIRKRLHLVILDNHQQPQHKGLFSSCYVDEYGSWTNEEITSIAKYWLTNKIDVKYPIEPVSIFDSVAQSIAEMYSSLDHFRYFTLRNVRKSIELFFKFYQNIREREDCRVTRCQSMLNRSNKSERIIQKNEQICVQLQTEINHLQEKLVKLDELFKMKKKNFSTAVEDCREEEKLINEMGIALDRLRQDVQADVERANPQYQNALNALKLLSKTDYDEIRTFRQPPQPVLAVMNTICIMFRRKPEWSEAKILMVKENFFDDLVYYDKENIPDEVFDMLTKIVEFDTFDPIFVGRSSKAASSLCSWILAVYEYAKVARSQRTKLEQVKAYQELYNKRQQILGEKRLRAEKLKEELTELITERRSQTSEFQGRIKRQNNFQSTIDKTRSMLQLIDQDIQFWKKEVEQGEFNQKTSIADALLIAFYFSFLSQFNIDQREYFLNDWRINILPNLLPIRSDFNLLQIINDEKELNNYLLNEEICSMGEDDSILNGKLLLHQLDQTFVLLINNPENEISSWNEFLQQTNIDKANEEIELYYEYKQNQGNQTSANTRIGSYQDRTQLYSRISSSKTTVTELTERSSLWESSTAVSRAPTSMLLSKSAGTVALSDLEQNKNLMSIPEYSLENYQRPEKNLIHLSANENTDEFDQILLSSMFFGVIVIIDQCDFLNLNSFLYRFIHWSSRNDQSSKFFPKIFRFADQEIFINSSFRLILNYRQIDRLEWSNLLLNNRLIDMSLSRKRLENDLWLRLVQLKCQGNFLQQIRSNQRNSLIALNEQIQRQENLIDILQTKENLTIDSEELLKTLEDFNRQRISIENTQSEHQIQRGILSSRTGAEFYRSISGDLIEMYILIRNSHLSIEIPLHWFIQIATNNLSRRIEMNWNNTSENFDQIHRVQSRETYLRCFHEICSYLSLSLSDEHFKYLLLFLAFIKQNSFEDLRLFQMILRKLNPSQQEILPEFLDDPQRPKFLPSHSWIFLSSDLIQKKFPNLSQHLIEYEQQWNEYLFSSKHFDFLNPSPWEKTTKISIIDRFLLCVILRSDQIFQLIENFLIHHYGGLLPEKSLAPIDEIYQLTNREILQPVNNIILLWINSSSFVDPIDEIRNLAKRFNQSVRLISSSDIKHLNQLIAQKRKSWLILTDINLFDQHLTLIRDFLLSSIDTKIWLLCNPSYEKNIPHWLIQRCLQVYLSDLNQSALQLRLEQNSSSNSQMKELIQIHTEIISKKIFGENWTMFIENDFHIDRHTKTFDYRNYIENEDQSIFINYLQQNSNPLAILEKYPQSFHRENEDLFQTFEQFFDGILLPIKENEIKKEDDMLLVESIIRSYLTHLRSIYSSPPCHSSSSSLVDLFILLEYQSLKTFEHHLINQMEHLLEIFAGIESPSLETNAFIRSILFDSNSIIANFINNYRSTLEHLSHSTSKNVNLRFIRRRKEFLQIIRLEQIRKQQIDDCSLRFKDDGKQPETSLLTVSGIHSSRNIHRNDEIIYLDDATSDQGKVIAMILFDRASPSFLPLISEQKIDLILLSIAKPHI